MLRTAIATILAIALGGSAAIAQEPIFRLTIPSPIIFSDEVVLPGGGGNTTPPEVSAQSATAVLGRAFTMTPQAINLVNPARWSIVAGEKPTWLGLNEATGELSGRPLQLGAGVTGLVLKAKGANGLEAVTSAFNITTEAASIVATPTEVWRVGGPSSAELAQSGATFPTWSLVGAPAWLSIDAATGQISGSPAAPGSASYSVVVEDQDGGLGYGDGTILVKDALSFATQPTNLSTMPGASKSFTASMSGNPDAPAYRIVDAVGEPSIYPSWMSLDGYTGKVTTAPPAGTVGGVSFGPFRVAGKDSAKGPWALSDTFTVSIPGTFEPVSFATVRQMLTGSGSNWTPSGDPQVYDRTSDVKSCMASGCSGVYVVVIFVANHARDYARIKLNGVQNVSSLTLGFNATPTVDGVVTLINSTTGATKSIVYGGGASSRTLNAINFPADEIRVAWNHVLNQSLTFSLRQISGTLY